MEVVTEIVEPIGPQGECREIQAWVSENPDGEPLPKAGQSWRAAAFVRDDRPIAIPPKVLEATTRLARQGFKPYQPWEGGRVGFNVTALEDFKQLPRVPSLPPALPKP